MLRENNDRVQQTPALKDSMLKVTDEGAAIMESKYDREPIRQAQGTVGCLSGCINLHVV